MWTTEQPLEAPSALLEAAAVLLEGAGGSLLTTSLNKALFYLDLHALLESGTTATGETYVALRAGPVVEGYRERLIGELERCRIAMQDDDNPSYMPVILRHPIKPTRLGAEMLAMARTVGRWAASKQAGELSDFSHENAAWRLAWDAGQGSSIDLRLAIQQIADADPWLDAPVSPEEAAVFDAADGGAARPW
jgi:Protein of unknown function (DUF4065)